MIDLKENLIGQRTPEPHLLYAGSCGTQGVALFRLTKLIWEAF